MGRHQAFYKNTETQSFLQVISWFSSQESMRKYPRPKNTKTQTNPNGEKRIKHQTLIPSMAATVNHLHITCKRVLPLQPHLRIELWNKGLHAPVKFILAERRFSLQALAARGILTPPLFHCFRFPKIPSWGRMLCICPRGWGGRIPCLWFSKMPCERGVTTFCKGFPCVFQSFSLLRTSNPERGLCIRASLSVSPVGKPRWSQRLLLHSCCCCYARNFRRPVGPRNEVGIFFLFLDLCSEVGSFSNQWILLIRNGFLLLKSNLVVVFHFWRRWGLAAIAHIQWRWGLVAISYF